MMVWFLAAFGMFTITLTKFHHYILPLVPAIAVLTGVVVERTARARAPRHDRGSSPRYFAVSGASLALLVYGVARLFPRRFSGEALGHPRVRRRCGILCVVLGVGRGRRRRALLGARSERRASRRRPERRYDRAMLAVLGLASAIVVVLVGRDLFTTVSGDVEGQVRLMHLFTYNYTRPWPDSLDFTGTLVGFTVVRRAPVHRA